jgi:hypothetical protein
MSNGPTIRATPQALNTQQYFRLTVILPKHQIGFGVPYPWIQGKIHTALF